MGYSHVQKSPLRWYIAAATLGIGVGAYALKGEMPQAAVAWAMAVVGLVLAGSFGRLKVEDAGDALHVRYGPLRIFGKQIPYAVMKGAHAGRTALIDGWGIHWIPWRGWTYNLWGRQCVAIRTERGTVRVGTDDAAGLERFLRNRLAPAEPRLSSQQQPMPMPEDPRGDHGISNLRAAAGFVRRSVQAVRERVGRAGNAAGHRG